MFDIGFSELVLIAVISLVVIGPKRLPETIRAVALWVGRLRRAASKIYQEMEKEVGMDDIRRQLHNEEVMNRLRELENAKLEFDDKPSPSPKPAAPPAAVEKKEP